MEVLGHKNNIYARGEGISQFKILALKKNTLWLLLINWIAESIKDKLLYVPIMIPAPPTDASKGRAGH